VGRQIERWMGARVEIKVSYLEHEVEETRGARLRGQSRNSHCVPDNIGGRVPLRVVPTERE
jgi:hypothetical protein